MKKEELFEIIGEADENKIEDAGKMQKVRKFNQKQIRVFGMVACLCVVVAAALGIGITKGGWFNSNLTSVEYTNETEKLTEYGVHSEPTTKQDLFTTTPICTSNPYGEEIFNEPDWDKRSLPGKFRSFTVGDTEYVYPFDMTEEHPVTRKAEKYISDKTFVFSEYDSTEHKTSGDVYTLEGFDKELALAVKFKDEENIYPYINTSYSPETLGEFLEAIDYYDTISYGTTYIDFIGEVDTKQNIEKYIQEYFFTDLKIKNKMDTDLSGSRVSIGISCSELGIENKAFYICEEGYIATNLIGYQFAFYVGKDKVDSFLKDVYDTSFAEINKAKDDLFATTSVDIVNYSEPYIPE